MAQLILTTATNILVAFEAILLAWLLSRAARTRFALLWSVSMFLVGVAMAAGAVRHGLYDDGTTADDVWALASALPIVLAAAIGIVAQLDLLAPGAARMAWPVVGLGALALSVWSVTTRDFRAAMAAYGITLLLLVVVAIVRWDKSSRTALAGVLCLGVGSYVLEARVDVLHPLDHVGLYHIFAAVALYLLYRWGRHQADPGAPRASNWVALGDVVTRGPVAFGLCVLVVVALVGQAVYLEDHNTYRVEASDLLPSSHPKNLEFTYLRENFSGSSRGLVVVVDAPLPRLREVVPTIAARFGELPAVEFVRHRVEREYFEDHLLLFQKQRDLERLRDHMAAHRSDVEAIFTHAGSLGELLGALADIVEGEQSDLASADVDEVAKDAKLTRDVVSFRTLLEAIPIALERMRDDQPLDSRSLGVPLSDLMLRGWYDRDDIAQLDRELLVPDDVWDERGTTSALIWIGTSKSDYDDAFTADFMRRAEVARAELAAAMPDVAVHFTGGIAAYRTYLDTVAQDTDDAQVWGLVSVFVLLVLGFRSLSSFALLMVLLAIGASGTLVFQNMFFGGINAIATAGTLAVIGVGSDYGVVFLSAQRALHARLVAETPPHKRKTDAQRLRLVRRSIKGALKSIGTATAMGALASVASFLALTGVDIVPSFGGESGLVGPGSEGFQPIRELALGGAFGLAYSALLMLVALPGILYATELARGSRLACRLAALVGRGAKLPVLSRLRRAARARRSLLQSDYERRWFWSLTRWAVRRRGTIMVLSLLLLIGALVIASGLRWSTGQRDVDPRVSLPVEVGDRLEARFGKSFENLLVYGPLASIRRVHASLERQEDVPGSNIGEVQSVDDYLPPADEPQETKIATAAQLDRELMGLRPRVPASLVPLTSREVERLAAELGAVTTTFAAVPAEGEAKRALDAARLQLAALVAALARQDELVPAADWLREVVPVDAAALQRTSERMRAIAEEAWLEAGVRAAAIQELKRLARALAAAERLGDGRLFRRDLVAAAARGLELRGIAREVCPRAEASTPDPCALDELAATLDALRALARMPDAPPEAAPALKVVTLARAEVEAATLPLGDFVETSASLEMALSGTAFAAARDRLEEALATLALRLGPSDPPRVGHSALLASAHRLRRSLDTLGSLAASSTYTSTVAAVPATAAAVDRLLAALERLGAEVPLRADGIVRGLDAAIAHELFDRITTVKAAAARTKRPLSVDDVPANALVMLRGRGAASDAYLVRVTPRVNMMARAAYDDAARAIEAAIAEARPEHGERVGYSGFESLLNLAMGYLEKTYTASMVGVCALVLLIVLFLFRSFAATFVTLAPIVLGTVMTLALMAVCDVPISMFTVVAVPIVIGVGVDSSVLVFASYREGPTAPSHDPVLEPIARVGKAVTLNVLTTVVPFAVLLASDMKGLAAIGVVLCAGTLFCLGAKLLLMPALISTLHDYAAPARDLGAALWPRRALTRTLSAVMGAWRAVRPQREALFSVERRGDIALVTARSPRLFAHDIDTAVKACKLLRAIARDPTLRGSIWRIAPPDRAAAARAAKPSRLDVGLDVLARRSAGELATTAWLADKPVIVIADGALAWTDLAIALHASFLLVTPRTRLTLGGSPHVAFATRLGRAALRFRAGPGATRRMLAGAAVDAREAVELHLADAVVPDGADPVDHALDIVHSEPFRDAVHTTVFTRQFGPPMPAIIARSVARARAI